MKKGWLKRLFGMTTAFVLACSLGLSLGACNKDDSGNKDNSGNELPGDQNNPGNIVDPGNNDDKTPETPAAKVTLALSTAKLALVVGGKTGTVKATVKNSTEAVEWKISDESVATIAIDGNTVTVTAVAEGKAEITATVGTITKKVEVNVTIPQPSISFDFEAVEMYIGDELTLTTTTENFTGEIEWSSSNDEVVTLAPDGDSATVLGVKKGTATITAKISDTVYATCVITVTRENIIWGIYDKNGTRVDTKDYSSLYDAINTLCGSASYSATAGYYVGDTEEPGEVTFTYSHVWKYLVKKDGTPYVLHDGKTAGGTIEIENGTLSGWSRGFAEDGLGFYTTSDFNVMTSESFSESSLYLTSRVSDWNTSNTDGAGGYNSDPNGMWMGWRSSLFRQGTSGVQAVSWADGTYNYEKITMELDMSGATMKPSNNPNQPARADMFIGTANLGDTSINNVYYYGLTFDAGTTATTEELEEGTQRAWYISFIKNDWTFGGGVTHYTMDALNRTIAETPSFYSTWDATNKVWKTENTKVTIDVHFLFSNEIADEPDYAMTIDVTAEVGDAEPVKTTETHDFGVPVYRNATSQTRYTYGVFYGPQYSDVAGNTLADLQCGATWENLKLVSTTGTFIEGSTKPDEMGLSDNVANLGFLAGRTKSMFNQVGIYGSDVLKVTGSDATGAILNFKYL